MAGYCVVLITKGYHPQLCGDSGTHPLTLEDAMEEASGLNGNGSLYAVMDWQEYLNHKPGCKDCEVLSNMVKSVEGSHTRRTRFIPTTKGQWIKMYGGQELLDLEGVEVVLCTSCDDVICNGWRVQKKNERIPTTSI